MPEPRNLADVAVLLDARDNVVTALVDVPAGEYRAADGSVLAVPEPVRAGFKVAIRPVARGRPVVKYGYPIGRATAAIAPGAVVHVHNLASLFADAPPARRRKGRARP